MILKQPLSAEENRSGTEEQAFLRQSPEEMIHNDPEEIQVRRSRNILYTIGTGVAAFGVWSIAKSILFLVTDMPRLTSIAKEAGESVEHVVADSVITALIIGIVLLVLLVDILLRLYIGVCARKHARGSLRKKTYLFFSCLMIAGSVFIIVSSVMSQSLQFRELGGTAAGTAIRMVGKTDISGTVMAVFVEATSMIMMIELVINANRILKAEKQKTV